MSMPAPSPHLIEVKAAPDAERETIGEYEPGAPAIISVTIAKAVNSIAISPGVMKKADVRTKSGSC
jgi:hypothetical protein